MDWVVARNHPSFQELKKRCTEEAAIGLFPIADAKKKPFFEVRTPSARADGTATSGGEGNCLTGALLTHVDVLWKASSVSTAHPSTYYSCHFYAQKHRKLCLFSFFSSVSVYIFGKDAPAGASVSIVQRNSKNEKAKVKAMFLICLEGPLTSVVDSGTGGEEVREFNTGAASLFLDCSSARLVANDLKQKVVIVATTASKQGLQEECRSFHDKCKKSIFALRQNVQAYKTSKKGSRTCAGEVDKVTRVAQATSPARRDDALCVGGGSYPCTHKRARLASDAYKFDMILPWQTKRIMNIQVVHRFYHPHVDPATNVERWWRDSVASFAGPVGRTRFTQYIWCYEPVKARTLFCTPGLADVLILNAGIGKLVIRPLSF